MSEPLTIALAGIGGYGEVYLKELLSAPAERGVRLVGAIDPQAERSAHLDEIRKRKIPVYADLTDFFAASSADLVIISAPIHLHAPLTSLALARGSRVLCEKPVTATVQEALSIEEEERKSHRFVAVGYQWSFSDAIQALKRDIMAGDLGRPVRLKTIVLWPRKASYYTRNSWAGALKASDGRWVLDSPVNNATAHYLFNMLYVLGATRETSARPREVQAELYRANPIENYDTAALRCRTADGVELLFFATHAVPSAAGPLFEYEFEQAVVHYGAGAPPMLLARWHNGQSRAYGDPNRDQLNKLWQTVAAIRTGAPLACGVKAALAHTLCVNGAQDAMPDITVFPAELIRTEEDAAKDCLTWVEGLQETFMECYEKNLLPAENGCVRWAREGKVVDLRDYRCFPGGS